MNTEQQIVDILTRIVGYDVGIGEKLLDDGVLDSLSTMKLIEELEKTFELQIPTSEFSYLNFNSSEAIANLIERLRN